MRRRLSIRARIIIGSTAVVVLLVLAACIAVYAQISSIAVSREKAVLHNIAEVYRGIIVEDPSEPFEKPGIDQHVAVQRAGDALARIHASTWRSRNTVAMPAAMKIAVAASERGENRARPQMP